MTKLNRQGAILRMTVLTAALLSVYGAVSAAPLELKDGGSHTYSSGEYDYVDVRHGSPKTITTTLDASGLTITDTRVDSNSGAVFAKGGIINLRDSIIDTTGKRSGLQAFSTLAGEATTTIIGDNLDITTQGASAHGAFLYVERSGNRSETNLTISNSRISTAGASANALIVGGTGNSSLTGSHLLTGNNLTIATTGTGSSGLKAQFLGNAVLNDSQIVSSGVSARGVDVASGSSVLLNNSNIVASTYGINADGAGSTIVGNGTHVSVTDTSPISGELVVAARAVKGAHIDLTGGSIAATGAGTYTRAILADAGSVVDTRGVAISTAGSKSHAVHAFGTIGKTAPIINVVGGTINTAGNESSGVYAQNGGTIVSSANIVTTGQAGFGAFTYNQGQISLDGGSIRTSGAALGGTTGSFGVLSKKDSSVLINGSSVVTAGNSADGLRAEENSLIQAKNSTIMTSGAGAHGLGAHSGSNITLDGGSITTAGSGSAGAFLGNDSSLTLNNVKVVSAGPSLQSSFTSAGQQQTINVGAGTDLTSNNGTLLQVVRESAGADGVVNLNLKSNSFSAGNIKDPEGENRVKVDKAAGAQWAGIVVDKTTTVIEEGGSSERSDFSTPGSVSVDSGGPVVFNNNTTIGGGISTGQGMTTTFNGNANIAQSVVGQQGATVGFTGNTVIGDSVAGASNSSFSFTGPSTSIGGSVAGTQGTSMVFGGGATIAQDVVGTGSSFVFSQTAPTTIGGSVQLDQGSTLKGGTTSTPITITGGTTVNSGATLGGNLFVSGALSGAGGSLSPGNSVGTQSYDTSAGFTGAYVAEVNGAGQSDLIIIRNGNINLAGVDLTVAQENGNGGYLLNHDYTIVRTENGDVVNKFQSETLDPVSFANARVKLDPAKYGQKDVKVSLSVDQAKVDRSDWSGNQNATYDGLMSVGSANTLAFAALASPDIKSTLNQLSGEAHASTQSALLNSGNLLVRTLSSRMRGNAGAGLLAGAPTAQASGSLPASAMPSSAAYPLWAQVVGSWQEQKGDSNTANTKTDTAGLFIGGDTQVGAGWRVGGALGFTDGKVKVSDRSSTSDVTSYTAALYGANSWATAKGKVNFLAGAGYTRHNIDSRRTVNVGGNQTLKADYDANTMQLFTELGYALPVGQASEVEPYVGLGWINQRAKGFSESGGSAALAGQSQTDSLTTFTLGVRGNTAFSAGKRDGKLFAGLGWRNASGDVNASRKLSFIQGNGAQFQVSGAPIAKNAAVLDLGGEMSVGKNTAMGVSYNGQFGNGSTDNAGSLYLKMRF